MEAIYFKKIVFKIGVIHSKWFFPNTSLLGKYDFLFAVENAKCTVYLNGVIVTSQSALTQLAAQSHLTAEIIFFFCQL